jgi:hypothetical protein
MEIKRRTALTQGEKLNLLHPTFSSTANAAIHMKPLAVEPERS